MLVRCLTFSFAVLIAATANAQWTTVWEAGTIDPGGWIDNGSGITFVQEGGENPPPGDPNSPAIDGQADDDFYFGGTYPDPIGTVPTEIAIERAFAGVDNALRMHFNLPDTLTDNDPFRFTTRPINLDGNGADPRYGVEISVNGTLVNPEQIIGNAELNTLLTTVEFKAGDVGLVSGAGADNILTLTGINYGAEGGGNWMGMDYHHLETIPVPEPGSLVLLLTGMFWSLPLLWSEASKRRSRK